MGRPKKVLSASGQLALVELETARDAVKDAKEALSQIEASRDEALLRAVRNGVPAERASLASGMSRTYAYHVFNRRGGR
jgi:hypothetical protein